MTDSTMPAPSSPVADEWAARVERIRAEIRAADRRLAMLDSSLWAAGFAIGAGYALGAALLLLA